MPSDDFVLPPVRSANCLGLAQVKRKSKGDLTNDVARLRRHVTITNAEAQEHYGPFLA